MFPYTTPNQYVSGVPPETSLKFPEISQNNGDGYNTEHTQAIPYTLRIHPRDVLKDYSTL